MQIENIFPTWGSTIKIDFEEFMADNTTAWADLLLERNLIVFKGFGPGLTDPEFFNFGAKFGRVWTMADYRGPVVGAMATSIDPTIADTTSDTPVSHFKNDNNSFRDDYMGYHADMAHIGQNSYPGRALYMTRNTINGTGVTSWLNLEHGWAQFTDQEKAAYDNVEIVNHNMYMVNQFMEVLPFLKTNPKTHKLSPRLNSLTSPYRVHKRIGGWINHIRKNGVALSWEQAKELAVDLIVQLEGKHNALYDHHWDEGDIIVYDNWFNIHKRGKVDSSGVKDGRLLRRLSFNFE